MREKRTFHIVLGIAVAAALWAAVAGAGCAIWAAVSKQTVEPRDYSGYTSYVTLQEAASFEDGVYHIKEKAIITGDQKFGDVRVSGFNFVIQGKLTVTGELELYGSMIVEGKLNAGKIKVINTENGYYLTVYGKLTAGAFDALNAEWNGIFIGGRVVIRGASNNSVYSCYGGSKLVVGKQTKDCSVILREYGNVPMPRISFNRSADVRYYAQYGGGVTGEFIANTINGRFIAPVTIVVLCFFGLHLFLTVVCLFLSSVLGAKRCGEKGKSYFDAKPLAYVSFTVGRNLGNFLTMGMLKPYIDSSYYRWKWGHTVIDGVRMRFFGEPKTIFYRNMRWRLLMMITLNIYWLWAAPRTHKWEIESVGTLDGSVMAQPYRLGAADFFRYAVSCLLLNLGTSALLALLYLFLNLIFAFQIVVLAIIGLLGYAALTLTVAAHLAANIRNDYLGLTWRQMSFGNRTLMSVVTYNHLLVIMLLCLITAGGYSCVGMYELERRLVREA